MPRDSSLSLTFRAIRVSLRTCLLCMLADSIYYQGEKCTLSSLGYSRNLMPRDGLYLSQGEEENSECCGNGKSLTVFQKGTGVVRSVLDDEYDSSNK